MALGFFGFFSKILLVGLQWIHGNIVGNYGWAIILMTVVIRIILFPLTHKSFVSMQKMQELNPKIQAIRQKYRSKLKDKQGRPNAEAQRKMNEEVMGLYKKEGVNPAGGCLPMLLQLPVLFAFYRLLSAAVELRHAPWMGWIQDLSAPDPFYILPLVMGASQFIQQKMTPSTADPMQRRIFMLMPVFFTVLFLGFPEWPGSLLAHQQCPGDRAAGCLSTHAAPGGRKPIAGIARWNNDELPKEILFRQLDRAGGPAGGPPLQTGGERGRLPKGREAAWLSEDPSSRGDRSRCRESQASA